MRRERLAVPGREGGHADRVGIELLLEEDRKVGLNHVPQLDVSLHDGLRRQYPPPTRAWSFVNVAQLRVVAASPSRWLTASASRLSIIPLGHQR